jgi:hypothetical protein
MTDDGILKIEHAATRCDCGGRLSEGQCTAGEWSVGCTLYPPPPGDGWYEVRLFTDICGARCVLWRQISLAQIGVKK